MLECSEIPNRVSSVRVRVPPTDTESLWRHNGFMAKSSQKTQRDFAHTWFIREWAEFAGFSQADAQKVLGWSKAKASDVWNGQQYNQSIIDELFIHMKARPYELLMHPEEAMALRRIRDLSPRLVSSQPVPNSGKPKIATNG